ncbi:hypothetical protein IFR04_001487 [Cadophora malorum]|uniref:SGNH hydrolase n=1 Tax=Cadophora malorum TaxID=108018 RepID=A0A8H7WID2_9HELO|nr:hypothetical protein IFR04_001487 [Cadophora malorum]
MITQPHLQAPLLSPSPSNLNPTGHNVPTLNLPHLGSFYALGDSYSAGIGANCSWVTDDYDPTGSCLKCKGAYPYQIIEIANSSASTSRSSPHQTPETKSNSSPENGNETQVYHLGCTGASISDILTVGWDNRTSQLELMSEAISRGEIGTWATLSVGGNDVGFANVVADCVMLNTASCESSLNATEAKVRDPNLVAQLVETYLSILEIAPVQDFTLIVTSYARFFNEVTEECDEHFFIRGRYLTREFRGRLNRMIEGLNTLIRVAVAIVQMQLVFGGSRMGVFFEDWDGGFEGHRFCEVGEEGDTRSWERDAWFFTVAGDDILEGGKMVKDEEVSGPMGEGRVDFERLARECASEAWVERELIGTDRLLCTWARTLEQEKLRGEGDEGRDDGEFERWSKTVYPWYVKKAMHPKTIAHAELGRRIYEKWSSGEYA